MIIKLIDAVSQFFNVLLTNGSPNESLSGHAFRVSSKWERVIDTLIFWEDSHCEKSHFNDVEYGKQLEPKK
ncbi:MAG: pseudouridine synthase [Methylophaga sp.]|nr:MAG: pseudouridine synthase [Methylophaga sp.]